MEDEALFFIDANPWSDGGEEECGDGDNEEVFWGFDF